MSDPGWYADPAQTPSRLRYWDGKAWTSQVRVDAAASGDGKGRVWALLAGLVIVVVVLVILDPFKTTLIGGPAPSYSPTISSWNETETPNPAQSVPSASVAQLRCDRQGPVKDAPPTVYNHRIRVGPMSMPVPADWEGPKMTGAVRYLQAAQGYTLNIEPSWFNQMAIGPTNFADPSTSLETQARTIVACLGGTEVKDRYDALRSLDLKPVSISGRQAVEADALFAWNDPDIEAEGFRIRVVVVDTTEGPYAFFGEASSDRDDVVALMDTLTANLALT